MPVVEHAEVKKNGYIEAEREGRKKNELKREREREGDRGKRMNEESKEKSNEWREWSKKNE